jgi:hypothetical protein
MSGSRIHLLLHEVRTALKENRFLLPLVPLVTLVAVGAYHEWLPIRFDSPAAFLANLLKTVWPAVAWIPPFLMLKRPDLRNPDAAWRTLPVSKGVVFGSRLLVVGLFTVALPALIVGVASLCAGDGMAGSQTALMAAYQWGYLWLGALAAYALRGYRGLALIPGIAVALVLSALAFWCIKSFDTQFTDSYSAREHRRAFGLLLPWLVVAVVGPVAVFLHLRKPDAKPRPWRWIAGAFLAFPAVVMLQSFIGDSGRSVMLPSTQLPAIEATLAYYSVYSVGTGFNGMASNAAIPLPPGYNAYRTDELGGYEWGFASGNWKSRSANGFIGKKDTAKLRAIFSPKTPGIDIMSGDSRSYNRKGSLGNWLTFVPTLGLTHPTVMGTLSANPEQWHPVPTTPRQFDIAIDFFEPKAPGNKWFTEKAGETVTINAGFPVHEALPPKVIFRAKLNTPDSGDKNHAEMPKGFALKEFLMTGKEFRVGFNKRRIFGAVGNVFESNYSHYSYYGVNHVGLLLNRRLEQVVFLDGRSTSYDGELTWIPSTGIRLTLDLPDKFPGRTPLPEAWMDEAELIVLESENGPATTLPVKLTFKVPAVK